MTGVRSAGPLRGLGQRTNACSGEEPSGDVWREREGWPAWLEPAWMTWSGSLRGRRESPRDMKKREQIQHPHSGAHGHRARQHIYTATCFKSRAAGDLVSQRNPEGLAAASAI